LPPAVCAVLGPRIDATGILPPNLVWGLVARIYADPITCERLHERAQGVLVHLLSDEPGWGNWPKDAGEALYIAVILGMWLEDAIAAEKPGLTKQELSQLEESVIERIVKCKDGQEPSF
jgi:hypothetical protein